MDEPENGGAIGPSELKKDGARDGVIIFASYTDVQLDELRHTIDRDRFPGNFDNLIAELERRTAARIDATPQADLFVGRFSRRDGIRGWIEAKTNRSPVYGMGSIEITSNELVLNGWQRTWLGAPLQAQVVFPKDRIRNVARESGTARFELKSAYRPVRRIAFSAESPALAERVVERLPTVASPGFERRWEAIRDFNARLRGVTQRLVVTPAIVTANVLMFVAMCVLTKKLGGFTQPELITWGANIGPLTVNGQWWRLLTATFVHFSLLHLLLNMWALWNIGRLCEYLFGRLTFTFLYFASGLLASLSSIAWNPDLSSVGASGAIFGIFGAFLAFFLNPHNRVPATIARRHWISTGAFAVFNLVNGALQPGIDNAAHVGGLLVGFALGWILTRPLEIGGRRPMGIQQEGLAVLVLALSTGAAIWQVKGIGSELTIPEQYYRSHAAFIRGEADNLRLWNELAGKAAAGAISDMELGERFERDIVPFWRAAHAQLDKENQNLKGRVRPYSLLVADFVSIRDVWAQKLVQALKDQDAARATEAKDLMLKANLAQARIERIEIRARMDHRPRALVNSPAITALRRLFIGYYWTCVDAPTVYGRIPTAADNKEDGPFARHALGCRAQQLFMSGDYGKLDSLMSDYSRALADLPDGSSRYEGLIGGLSDLFYEGGLDALQLLGRTADWRRSVNNSTRPDVLEAMIFTASAWSVRGTGYAKSVSAQQWALFGYRTEMAAAALADTVDSARSDPVWYQLSLNIGLDQGLDADHLRTVFDEGNGRFPLYRPLERRMMRILMPRWGGSYDQEEQLINAIYKKTARGRGFERYAELYSEYSDLEGDEVDLFSDSEALWSGMRSGYIGLLKRYSTSDFVLNRFANMACRAGDADQYRALRGSVVRRNSSAAWSAKYSQEACDKKFADSALAVSTVAAPRSEPGLIRIQSLGGLQLGMTAKQLLDAKGAPILQQQRTWTYNTVDSSHNGVLTAVFSATPEGSDEKVVAIEFVGDEVSAPPDLPYLNGLTEDALKERFGYLIGMGSPSKDIMTLRFRNGIYADTRNGKVFRYGIYAVKLPNY